MKSFCSFFYFLFTLISFTFFSSLFLSALHSLCSFPCLLFLFPLPPHLPFFQSQLLPCFFLKAFWMTRQHQLQWLGIVTTFQNLDLDQILVTVFSVKKQKQKKHLASTLSYKMLSITGVFQPNEIYQICVKKVKIASESKIYVRIKSDRFKRIHLNSFIPFQGVKRKGIKI